MAATHLVHHTSGYIFRYCIPPDIQPFIQKKELRYSLKTGSLRCAKTRARAMASYISAVISDIRESGPMVNTIADQINGQLKGMLEETTGQVSAIKRPAMPVRQTGGWPMPRGFGAVASSPRLSEVLQRYVAEANTTRQWSPKSEKEITSSIELFIQVAGDRQINAIDRTEVRKYKETLLKLPSNLKKIPKY
ncbi:MAG: hypothetical protein GY703_24555, partial [Gammaproteobacteria bacterium]|nr:hypothetical protein [Gammaproteobacteria bacterium]